MVVGNTSNIIANNIFVDTRRHLNSNSATQLKPQKDFVRGSAAPLSDYSKGKQDAWLKLHAGIGKYFGQVIVSFIFPVLCYRRFFQVLLSVRVAMGKLQNHPQFRCLTIQLFF
uniref:Uncharacterized protein n=1 Tax=Caenorhabditis japonica TaxID=281687 RepID=A0A8R1EKC5_CAEJA